jgi:signal transduction histidine kinase/CheY-like chemotaxis protein
VGKTYEALKLDRLAQTLKDGDPAYGQIYSPGCQEKSILDADWPRSFVLMPIFTELEWWGFIGFDDENYDRQWNRVEIEALKTAANILGAALQRKLTEATLYQAQKLESIGILAGGIAHDFNNLLTSILTQTSLSLYKIPADSAARPHLKKVIQTSEQAADLVKQLLGYAGQGQYVIEPLNLNDVLNDNLGLFNTISRARINFNLALAPNLPTVEADRSQIQQVIMNLIINGTESIDDSDGLVQITTSTIFPIKPIQIFGRQELPPGQYVCLSVQDNGSGIKSELVPKIFDPFFSTKSNGRGLGLSATLGIIKAHGGGLQVISAEGQGAEFFVYLPASRKAAMMQPEPKPFQGELEAVILIIDDEKSVLEPLKEGLEMLGAEVFVSENGFEGIDIYKRHHQVIDLIILDMIMPGMDGRETFVQLQKINPGLKVILSSGYSEVELLRQFAEGEIIRFLKKPYRFEKLTSEINQALQFQKIVKFPIDSEPGS